eukprot:gene6883-9285_t
MDKVCNVQVAIPSAPDLILDLLVADGGLLSSQALCRAGALMGIGESTLRVGLTRLAADGKIARGERGIWQRRFWEHLIRDENDYARHVDYCYINPVKHRLVTKVSDWPHSSFHRDARAGIYPSDWAGDAGATGIFGERSE